MIIRYRIAYLLLLAVAISCTNFQEEEVPVNFGVDISTLDFAMIPSTRSVTVSSGKKWGVIGNPEWISLQSISPGRSPYEWTANFVAEANDEYNREGKIMIKAGSDIAEISVSQEGAKGKYVAVESVSVSPKELTLTEGDKTSLTYSISPTNASIQDVKWESSSPSVATVSQSGQIEAIAEGTTLITITTEDGNKTASCAVTVKPKVIPVTGVSLDKTSLTMTEGDVQELTATVTPSNATDKSVTWSSSNTSVATVSSVGVVTAKSVGSATITVKTIDGEKTATCSVTVKAKTIAVTGVELDKTSISMTVGDTQSLTATVTPTNATNKSVTWSSSNTSIATVSSSGVVTAKSAGSATITVTTNDGGKKATCTVTVKDQKVSVTGVSLNNTSLTMTEGDTQTLTATVTPSNATDKSVTWSSSNTTVATVSSSGVITAKTAGSATITVTTNDGGKKATCAVTVKAKTVSVTGVSLNKTSISMTVGDTQTLTATVTPSNATDKSVKWSSSNTSVATVSSSGVVTAKAAGTAKITVTTNDGGKTATCSVSVQAATVSVTGVSLNMTSLSMTVGDTQTLTATVTPSNATNKSVTWSSSNTSVATVSSTGVVTAKAAGTTTITVITSNGNKTATCMITVIEQSDSFTIDTWRLNPDYIIGNQDRLNPVDPMDYTKSYAPYNVDKYGYGAVYGTSAYSSSYERQYSILSEHFKEYMLNFEINKESIYRFKIKNYDYRIVDWQVVSGGGSYGIVYDNGCNLAYVELTGTELITIIDNPALVPYLILTNDSLISKEYDVLIEVTEICPTLNTSRNGYYFVVFEGLDVKLNLFNVKLGSFRDINDYVYTHELIEGIYDKNNQRIIEWKNGAWILTEKAQSYGLCDNSNLMVYMKSRLSFIWDTEESFGDCLFTFDVSQLLFPTSLVATDSGIDWWNNGRNLQVDKRAQFTVIIEYADEILAEGLGTVTVLATANSTHPLHTENGTLWLPNTYRDGWFYATNSE